MQTTPNLHDFNTARDGLARALRQKLQHVDGDSQRPLFAARQSANDVFDNAPDKLDLLHKATGRAQTHEFLVRITGDHERPICRILAILLCMEMTLDDFDRFCTEIIENEQLNDNDLPIEQDVAVELLSKRGRLFYETQFEWCPIILKEGCKVDYKDHRSHCPLPRLQSVQIGRGASGVVTKVLLAKGHLELEHGLSKQAFFAQKNFKITGRGFVKEWEAIRKITTDCKSHKNICVALASLETATHYSIFFPVATCNLHEYLTQSSKHLPDDYYPPGGYILQQKRAIIEQAVYLVDALQYLHEGLHRISSQKTTLLHLDLKAQNVLVTMTGDLLFQLADFGLSRVKDTEDASTKSRAGDGSMCLAPEGYGLEARVSAASDVWAMGCILSMILVFVEQGPESVLSFQRQRERLPTNGAWFFSKGTAATNDAFRNVHNQIFTRHSCVDIQLAQLVTLAQPEEKATLDNFTRILLQDVLRANPLSRCTARALRDELVRCVIGTQTPRLNNLAEDLCSAARAGLELGFEKTLKEYLRRPPISLSVVRSPLSLAAERGSTKIVSTLLQEPSLSVDSFDRYGKTALIYAAENGHEDVVRLLLDHDMAHISTSSSKFHDWTPLYCAVFNNHSDAVRMLVERGAAIDVFDAYGRTPLSWACQKGYRSVVEILLKARQIVLKDDIDGQSPKSRALASGHREIVSLLDKHERFWQLRKLISR